MEQELVFANVTRTACVKISLFNQDELTNDEQKSELLCDGATALTDHRLICGEVFDLDSSRDRVKLYS